MFANLATAIPSGAVMTLSLLFIMHTLVNLVPGPHANATRPISSQWLHVDPPQPLIADAWDPADIPRFVPPPTPRIVDNGDATTVISIPRGPLLRPGTGDKTLTPYLSDGPLVSVINVQPTYPAAAAQRGLEGTVLVQFDVLTDGTVDNVAVVESSNAIFEGAAMQAAHRFRFRARIVDGEPRISRGIRYQFRFEMQK